MNRFDQPISFEKKENDLLMIGEILIDMISKEYSEDLVSDDFKRYFGGSAANIAMNAKSLGARSQVVSAVGMDSLGDFLVKHLEKHNLDSRLIERVKVPTSMVVLNKSKDTPAPIFYRGADYHIQFTEELQNVIQQTKVIHFSSWPISKSKSRRVVESVIELARKYGVLVCFDPNYHESLWDDSEDGITIMKEMISRVDIIKPSSDDAERLFGADTPENQIEKFHRLGCPFVIMTLGEQGAVVSIDGEKRYYNSMAKKVVDTTGAGDAFWAGFYTGITQGETVENSLTIGSLTSAYKLQFTGSVIKLPHYKTLIKSEMNV